jgi:DNA-binding NarL/FixJ family response regulator
MNLLLCTADTLLRERLHQILQHDYSLHEARSVTEIEAWKKRGNIDMMVLHRSLIDMDFLKGIETLPFIVLADVPEDNEAVAMLRLGALGYTNAYISAPRLLDALKTVLSGRVWVGRRLMQKIIHGTTAAFSAADRSLMESLTDRELEAARLIRKGWSNSRIAEELDITERTVKAHVGSLFRKTGTSSRLQLALLMNTQALDN